VDPPRSPGTTGRRNTPVTAKVGRNDPCPCGSGKKYKRCCIGKAEQPSPAYHADIPEEFVLTELLERSPEFLAFYQAERPKIPGHLQWAQDSSLPQGIDYRYTCLPGVKLIRLRRVPAVLADATKIAHELEHAVLDTDGFPSTGYAHGKHEDLSSALTSMLHDPLVNARLRAYGFNLPADYEREVRKSKRSLASHIQSPTHPSDRVRWTINCVGQVLEWRVAYHKTSAEQPEFHRWFNTRYPDLAPDTQDLLSLVDALGFDTPEKQAALFTQIITRYNLSPSVVLVTPDMLAP